MELLWVPRGEREEGTERRGSRGGREGERDEGEWEKEAGCSVCFENRGERKGNKMKRRNRRWKEGEGRKRLKSDGRLLPKAKSAVSPPCVTVYSNVTYYRVESELWRRIQRQLKTSLPRRIKLKGRMKLKRERMWKVRGWKRKRETFKTLKEKSWHTSATSFAESLGVFVCSVWLICQNLLHFPFFAYPRDFFFLCSKTSFHRAAWMNDKLCGSQIAHDVSAFHSPLCHGWKLQVVWRLSCSVV